MYAYNKCTETCPLHELCPCVPVLGRASRRSPEEEAAGVGEDAATAQRTAERVGGGRWRGHERRAGYTDEALSLVLPFFFLGKHKRACASNRSGVESTAH